MPRFDRRQTYPLYDTTDIRDTNIFHDIVIEGAIVPKRVGGVIKSLGPNIEPVNRSVQLIGGPYAYKIPFGRFTRGGASKQFGKRII